MISVVIPMYNSEKTIVDVLESIRKQTVLEKIVEILIINDGSTDNSLPIIENYQQRYPLLPIKIINKKNGGVSSARNSGLKAAVGDWIALLDSDDEWLPNKLEEQMKYIEKYPNMRFIGTNRNDEYVTRGKKIEEKLFCLTVKDILYKMWPHTSTALIHRDVILNIGYFDESRKYAEDGQYWMKIASKYDVFYLYDSLEIAGKGKPTFGHSGLSANLKEMHKGCISNINEAYQLHYINIWYRIFLLNFEQLKYIRRKIIVVRKI